MNYPPLDFERLARYSKRLDESFIYCIDELDLITPENILGKVTGGDILEGKSRLIAINAHSWGIHITALGKKITSLEWNS